MTAAAQLAVTISLPGAEYVLGAPLQLGVEYLNRSAEPLKMRDPARGPDVILFIEQLGGGRVMAMFGKLLRKRSAGVEAVVPEPAPEVQLAPGGSHRFEVDAWARWPSLWKPGLASLRVEDQTPGRDNPVSNALDLATRFAEESVTRLLAALRDPELDAGVRYAAGEWLKQLPGYRDPESFEELWKALRPEEAALLVARMNASRG